MQDRVKLLQDISARERASRKAAETLLEEKSLQLYEKNQRVEKGRQAVEFLNMHLINITSSSPDGIITCSMQLKVLTINATTARQLKLAAADIKGQPLERFIPGLREKIIEQKKKNFEILETRVHRQDGSEFIADIRGSLSLRGKEKYIVLFVHDISRRLAARHEKKQMESQYDEARRLEAIGALSAGIAHEINTPIQYIGDNLGFLLDTMEKIHGSYLNYTALSQALKAHKNPKELIDIIDQYNSDIKLPLLIGDIDEAIRESLEGINQVRDIILLMKEFAHPGGSEQDEADINDTIKGVIKITTSRHKGAAEIELDLCNTLPNLICRRNQIRQVILNMVLNAVDAIEETQTQAGKIRIETRSDADSLYIIISDTGPGIPESLISKVFDPFFTTKPVGKGTGQGLALAKDFIVTGHNGDLRLIETEGFNTSFEISLPLQKKENNLLEQIYAA